MTMRTYPRLERPWLIAMLLVGVLGSLGPTTGIGPAGAFFLFVPLFIGAFVVVPRFFRVAVSGVLAGIVTGAVVLGGLLRLAMRMVAILDDTLEPVFTSETFVIIFVGGFMGLTVGLVVAIMSRLWRLRPALVGLVMGVLGVGLLLMSADLRSELFDLGAGPLVNLPMFAGAFAAFGWTLTIGVAWLQRRLPMTPGRSLSEAVRPLEPAAA